MQAAFELCLEVSFVVRELFFEAFAFADFAVDHPVQADVLLGEAPLEVRVLLVQLAVFGSEFRLLLPLLPEGLFELGDAGILLLGGPGEAVAL